MDSTTCSEVHLPSPPLLQSPSGSLTSGSNYSFSWLSPRNHHQSIFYSRDTRGVLGCPWEQCHVECNQSQVIPPGNSQPVDASMRQRRAEQTQHPPTMPCPRLSPVNPNPTQRAPGCSLDWHSPGGCQGEQNAKVPSQHSTSPDVSRNKRERTTNHRRSQGKLRKRARVLSQVEPFGDLTVAHGDPRLGDTGPLNVPHRQLRSLQSKQQSNRVLWSSGLPKEAGLRGKEGTGLQLLSKE